MKNTDKNEIKVGDVVRQLGEVEYADGVKEKFSKKMWKVSKIEDGILYHSVTFQDELGREFTQDEPISLDPDTKYLVVGDNKGARNEYKEKGKVIKVKPGGVPQNYRVLKDIKDYGWKEGDIVKVVGRVSFETLEGGYLEEVSNDLKNKHVHIVVDPVKVQLATNN